MNILHPIKSLEQWALKRLLHRSLEGLNIAKEDLKEYWELHEDEIYTKVGKAIKNTVVDIITKAITPRNDISEN